MKDLIMAATSLLSILAVFLSRWTGCGAVLSIEPDGRGGGNNPGRRRGSLFCCAVSSGLERRASEWMDRCRANAVASLVAMMTGQ